MALEGEFGGEVTDAEAAAITTVAGAIALIEARLTPARSDADSSTAAPRRDREAAAIDVAAARDSGAGEAW